MDDGEEDGWAGDVDEKAGSVEDGVPDMEVATVDDVPSLASDMFLAWA